MMEIAKWVVIGITAIGIIYNIGVLHGVVKNDIRHLQKTVDEIWKQLNGIKKILMEKK